MASDCPLARRRQLGEGAERPGRESSSGNACTGWEHADSSVMETYLTAPSASCLQCPGRPVAHTLVSRPLSEKQHSFPRGPSWNRVQEGSGFRDRQVGMQSHAELGWRGHPSPCRWRQRGPPPYARLRAPHHTLDGHRGCPSSLPSGSQHPPLPTGFAPQRLSPEPHPHGALFWRLETDSPN